MEVIKNTTVVINDNSRYQGTLFQEVEFKFDIKGESKKAFLPFLGCLFVECNEVSEHLMFNSAVVEHADLCGLTEVEIGPDQLKLEAKFAKKIIKAAKKNDLDMVVALRGCAEVIEGIRHDRELTQGKSLDQIVNPLISKA